MNINNGLFVSIQGPTAAEQSRGAVKQFKGDGTHFLTVVGLKELIGVRIGSCTIPLEIEQQFPDNSKPNDGHNFITTKLPLVALQHDESGTPILLRSTQSNHGIWQEGATIYVTGEWEEVAEVVPEEASSTPEKPTKPAKPAAGAAGNQGGQGNGS